MSNAYICRDLIPAQITANNSRELFSIDVGILLKRLASLCLYSIMSDSSEGQSPSVLEKKSDVQLCVIVFPDVLMAMNSHRK